MNDSELDALVTSTVLTDHQVASLPLDGLCTELRERTMTITDHPSTEDRATPMPSHRPHRHRRIIVRMTAAAAALAIVAGVAVASSGERSTSAYGAEAIAFAETSPRLILDAAGWQVTSVDELDEPMGEMRFGLHGATIGEPASPGGENTLELTWRPIDSAEDRATDGANFAPLGGIDIAGHPALLYRSRGVDTFTAQWQQNDLMVELRGDRTTEDRFRALAATIEPVDADTWLDSLPDTAVLPDELPGTIADLRRGIPAPPGFDASDLDDIGVTDRPRLALTVTGLIACAWIEQFETAAASGDSAAKDAANAALAETHEWPALEELARDGRPPIVFWRTVDQIVETGVVGPRGGPDEEGWANALSCPAA